MGYIIAFVTGSLFGFFGMGLIAGSGNHNNFDEAYERGRRDALKEMNSNIT